MFNNSSFLILILVSLLSFGAQAKGSKNNSPDEIANFANQTLEEHKQAHYKVRNNARTWTMAEIPQRFFSKISQVKTPDQQIDMLINMSHKVDNSLTEKKGLLYKNIKNEGQRNVIFRLGEQLRTDLNEIREIKDPKEKEKSLYEYYKNVSSPKKRIEDMRRRADELRREENDSELALRLNESEIIKGIDMNHLTDKDLDYLMVERYGDTVASDPIYHSLQSEYQARVLEKMIAHIVTIGSYIILAIIVAATIATITTVVLGVVIILIAVAVVLIVMLV